MTTLLAVILLVLIIAQCSVAASQSQVKPICYSGSSVYQLVTQNCHDQDPSYNGTWYCATMEICESFISKERSCVQTRGCAKYEECVSSQSSSGVYNGQSVQVTSGINPGGMQMTATCCQAYNFPNDDAVALDYSNICNASARRYAVSILAAFAVSSIFLLSAW